MEADGARVDAGLPALAVVRKLHVIAAVTSASMKICVREYVLIQRIDSSS